jgi:two-component system KDP operon response regulator KdpE
MVHATPEAAARPQTAIPYVLVADDEPHVAKLVATALHEDGIQVVTAAGGRDAIRKARERDPELIILDIAMPDIDGFEVMRELRTWSRARIMLVTSRGSTADKVAGLDLGADDYLAKPFHPTELAARAKALVRGSRRYLPERPGRVELGSLVIDIDRRLVTRHGQPVSLTGTEWLILERLAIADGALVRSVDLLAALWGPEYRNDLQRLRGWISRLRRKIGAAPGEPGAIINHPRVGYSLQVAPDS